MSLIAIPQIVRENTSAFLLLGALGAYAAYYYMKVVQKPQVFGKDGKFLQFVQRHIPMLREPFMPTMWCFSYHLQTIGPILMKFFNSIPYRSEKLRLADGGEVVLDWVENDDDERYSNETRPTVLLLPGLTGSSQSHYAINMMKAVKKHGYRSVVFNNRGFGGAEIKTPRTFCAANTEDLEFVIQHIHSVNPNAPVIAVGISIGGIILFNYLAKVGENTPLVAAMTVSVAWNTFVSTESLEKPVNSILFNRFLAKELTKVLARNVQMFEEHVDIGHAMQSQTIKQFDERFTAKMFGYETVDHYYADASLHTKVLHIGIPTLCLSAGDDPFAPLETIPTADAKEQSNIALVVTSHGGHVGFTEGFLPRGNSYMIRLFEQFVDGFFQHGMTEVLCKTE
ncbi:phospholipase ABHD3-like [Patiria miniata]|uniref:Phospholipase ABHD3 n=1 Tax=Patiria miniata TaxID=46514 RepID=A0A913ZJW5_PATMI|nr:phospholipase ABHD3-like [Patiria miniata]